MEQAGPQLFQEAAQHPLPGPDEEHSCVVDMRAARCRRTALPDDGVVPEPAQRPLEELDPVNVVPGVKVELAAGTGQCEQLTEVTLVEAGQRIGLESGSALRHHPDHRPVGVELDGDRCHDQRVLHPVPCNVRSDDAVTPDQLVRSRVHVDPVLQVEQTAVQLAYLLGAPGLLGPWPPLLLPPRLESRPQRLKLLLCFHQARFRVVREWTVQVRRQLPRRPQGTDRRGQSYPKPAGAIGGDADLAGWVGGKCVLPERAPCGDRAGRLLHLCPHGHQVVDQRDSPVEDQLRGLGRGRGAGEHGSPSVVGTCRI
ncbi:hypothetical protein ACGFIP_16695 [Micromonospora zamorensis]|uniref:hypothetical protein n=1 Tax=Micromonospora zamorensis TaxID=709883 RepID=UPI00371C2A35